MLLKQSSGNIYNYAKKIFQNNIYGDTWGAKSAKTQYLRTTFAR